MIDIVKFSTDWAKAEVFSAKIVWLFSAIYLVAAVGFWYLGRTEMAKSFTWPLLVAGLVLISIGAGLFFANKPRIEKFEQEYRQDPGTFIKREIERTANSQKQLTLVFRILPAIVMIAAIIILCFPRSSSWRAIGITVIITAAFLMVVDSNTDSRNTVYHSRLIQLKP